MPSGATSAVATSRTRLCETNATYLLLPVISCERPLNEEASTKRRAQRASVRVYLQHVAVRQLQRDVSRPFAPNGPTTQMPLLARDILPARLFAAREDGGVARRLQPPQRAAPPFHFHSGPLPSNLQRQSHDH
jgi:hypothetical protein